MPSASCLRSFRSLGPDKGATTLRVHSALCSPQPREPQRKADTIHEQFNRLQALSRPVLLFVTPTFKFKPRMASTAVEVFTHVFSCCLSRRGSRRDLVVRSSFSFRFIRFWPLHFMVTPAFPSFPDTCRYFPSNFRAPFVGTHVRGLDIDLPRSSFIISSTPFLRLLLPEADTHPAFQLFAVHAQGKLPSYNVKHSPVLFDPILCLLPSPASSSSFQFVRPHLTKTRI